MEDGPDSRPTSICDLVPKPRSAIENAHTPSASGAQHFNVARLSTLSFPDTRDFTTSRDSIPFTTRGKRKSTMSPTTTTADHPAEEERGGDWEDWEEQGREDADEKELNAYRDQVDKRDKAFDKEIMFLKSWFKEEALVASRDLLAELKANRHDEHYQLYRHRMKGCKDFDKMMSEVSWKATDLFIQARLQQAKRTILSTLKDMITDVDTELTYAR